MLVWRCRNLAAVAIQCLLLADTASARSFMATLLKRGDCTSQTVASGDSCGSLASKCGISGDDFTKYNPDPNMCSTLAVGQRVCCSEGTLPDIRPKPNLDMSCASYVVQSGDTCSAIAASNGLKVDDLARFNDKTTWGWSGCDQLGAQLKICLSEGSPPMPEPIDNAVCGPLKPGSERPTDGSSLASLNPCPLNSCCTRWGQCGITPEFCTAETGPTGNPGTAPPGRNGCISNCGTDVTNNKARPLQHIDVGYYESWNFDRPCLNMRADSVDTLKYTHYHWGFATINPDTFAVEINDTWKQWDRFKSLGTIKRIVSFGGWGFSTDPSTYDILRRAVDPAEVDNFVNAIVAFVQNEGLDGVDFDWEYPGAPDIPGIPPGQPSDAYNYLVFLKTLRSRLPSYMTLSIAAPASYWYLKQFPIAYIAEVVDYIVYMTYDLHGQWDYGNKWSQEGCPGGNCLRSHVNLTETMYALAMITKAGVPSNKISVGISSYGRSFGMTQAGCATEMCTFGGPDSTAQPGECTKVAGYISNAEIREIFDNGGPSTLGWYDTSSNSDILAYGNQQWVAYMSDDTRSSRSTYYKSLNFAGTTDWAVDLLQYTDDDGDPTDADDDLEWFPDTVPDPPDCSATFNSIEELDTAGDLPEDCKPMYTIMALLGSLKSGVQSYTDMMNDGYDHKFDTYSHAVADQASKSVSDFVNGHGNDYFTCRVAESAICCSQCEGKNGNGAGDPCAYCFNDDACYVRTHGSKRDVFGAELLNETLAYSENAVMARDTPTGSENDLVLNLKTVIVDEPCPPDYSKRGYGSDDPYESSVWWTMKDGKADKFNADLLENTGIPTDKIKWGNHNRGNDCMPSAKADDGCWNLGIDYNFPYPDGYAASDVKDPKKVVQQALSTSDNLVQQMSDALVNLQLGTYYGDEKELVDSMSIPVLMIVNSVEDMQQIGDAGEKIEEEKRKAIILAFIGALLFFIPIAGEVLGTVAEVGDLAAILSIVAAAGEGAMGVYQIVDNKDNPLLGIMSLVLAPLGLSSLGQVSKAAKLRRDMTDTDITKLGGKIAGRMNIVKKVIGQCRRA